MDLEDREYLKDRLLEAYKKFHSDSEIKKGYANNITHYDDNPFFHQL